ncbi:MAG: S8 family serine peptidase [Verrucomicrobiae bacterium]|nr:S8 family serine peptidase [Verrucomicrobiae bacterium]
MSEELFVLMPPSGFRAASASLTFGLRDLFGARPRLRLPRVRLLDSIADDGPKLVALRPDRAPSLRAACPGLRVEPLRFFRPALAPRVRPAARPHLAAAERLRRWTLRVIAADGAPVPGSWIVLLTHAKTRTGVEAVTDASGTARFSLPASVSRAQQVLVYPRSGFWGALRRNIALDTLREIRLRPAEPSWPGALGHFYGAARDEAGRGVRVAVVDTGVDRAHADLAVAGGRNTVVGEKPNDFGDNGEGHGTHVAGLIAGRGRPPSGFRGLAPAAELRSYRVFAKGRGEASNYALAKALDAAAHDGCDLINLSLGGGAPDPVLRAAIEHTRRHGALVLAAAGNERRSPVSFPASDSLAFAVSAMGREGTFPEDSVEALDVAPPRGTDRKNFLAAFSNIGIEMDLTAPGVGIVSTFPGGYAAMSGTSMACPVATGAAAAHFSRQPSLLARQRDAERSARMAAAVLDATRVLGFGPEYEGQGMPTL